MKSFQEQMKEIEENTMSDLGLIRDQNGFIRHNKTPTIENDNDEINDYDDCSGEYKSIVEEINGLSRGE